MYSVDWRFQQKQKQAVGLGGAVKFLWLHTLVTTPSFSNGLGKTLF